jgi:hypothetical protein
MEAKMNTFKITSKAGSTRSFTTTTEGRAVLATAIAVGGHDPRTLKVEKDTGETKGIESLFAAELRAQGCPSSKVREMALLRAATEAGEMAHAKGESMTPPATSPKLQAAFIGGWDQADAHATSEIERLVSDGHPRDEAEELVRG